jgi:hypothetical protein
MTIPLIIAAQDGDLQNVTSLLQKSVNINAKDDYGDTALIKASNRGHSAIVAVLLQNEDLDVNLQDRDGKTALFWASSIGYDAIVVELLKRVDVDVSLRDDRNTTALDEATRFGYTDIITCVQESIFQRGLYEDVGVESYQTPIDKTRDMLCHAIQSQIPDELSVRYITRCDTNKLLGTGNFGNAYLGEDRVLSKQFVVKKIRFTRNDQTAVDEIRSIFQKEILVRPFFNCVWQYWICRISQKPDSRPSLHLAIPTSFPCTGTH